MEVPKLGVKSELQPLAYATATAIATPDLSRISDLHHSLWQHQTLNPLSRARGQTCILMDTSWVLNLMSHNGNSTWEFLIENGCQEFLLWLSRLRTQLVSMRMQV